MQTPRTATWVVVLAHLALLSAATVAAQITTATISGSVRDDQGGVIPGATVTLLSATRGTRTEGVTNAQGDFVFPNVPGDTYTVVVAMPGFKSLERRDLTVMNCATGSRWSKNSADAQSLMIATGWSAWKSSGVNERPCISGTPAALK